MPVPFYPNDIKSELIGMHALNFAIGHNSASRSVMLSSHFGQKLTLVHGTESRIQTGAEKEFAKYTFNVKMPVNAKIMQVIDRYPASVGEDAIPHNPESYVVYEDMDTREIGCLTVPQFISHHQYFGYALKPTKESAKLTPGAVITKDTVLFDSPAVTENGGYAYGRELNIALMSHPAVAEDGIMISEDVLEKLEFDVFEKRVVSFGSKNYPLNMYGSATNYKPFPEIGEWVGKHRILMMLREMDVDLCPVDMSIYDLCEPDHTHDTPIYGRGTEGRVIDIKVYHDDDPTGPTPSGMTTMLDKYADAYKQFCQKILNVESQLRYEHKRKFNQDKLAITPEFHQLIREAMVVLDKGTQTKRQDSTGKKQQRLNKEYRKEPLDDYRVEFVIQYRIRPTVGFKMVAMEGDKGVICHIEKPENMPVDQNGNRADVVMDDNSTISRMNLGRLYRQYIGAAVRDVSQHVRKMLGIKQMREYKAIKAVEEVYKKDPQLVKAAHDYAAGFFKLITKEQYQQYQDMSVPDMIENLGAAVADGFYVYYPIENQKEPVDVIKDIQKHYPPVYGPVTYVDNSGRKVVSKGKVRIGPTYMMLLDKIGDGWSSVASGKLQHFGVLSPINKSEKYTRPWHNSPVRTTGETEGRIYAGYCGREAIAEIMDRNNSPTTHEQIVKTILGSNTPGNIPHAVDRNVVPLGGAKPIQLWRHFVMCSGWRPVYKPE